MMKMIQVCMNFETLNFVDVGLHLIAGNKTASVGKQR